MLLEAGASPFHIVTFDTDSHLSMTQLVKHWKSIWDYALNVYRKYFLRFSLFSISLIRYEITFIIHVSLDINLKLHKVMYLCTQYSIKLSFPHSAVHVPRTWLHDHSRNIGHWDSARLFDHFFLFYTESASPTVLRPTSSLYGVDQYNCLFHGGSSNRNGIVHFAYGNSASVMIMDRYKLVVSFANTTSKSEHVLSDNIKMNSH